MSNPVFTFNWLGTDNPNDPSGTACFACGEHRVFIEMNTLAEALSLDSLIKRACGQSKRQTLDRVLSGTSDLIRSYRYD